MKAQVVTWSLEIKRPLRSSVDHSYRALVFPEAGLFIARRRRAGHGLDPQLHLISGWNERGELMFQSAAMSADNEDLPGHFDQLTLCESVDVPDEFVQVVVEHVRNAQMLQRALNHFVSAFEWLDDPMLFRAGVRR